MGSPVMRMGMQQQQQIPSTIGVDNNPLTSQFGGNQSSGGMMNMGSGQNMMGFNGSGRNGGMSMSGMSGPPNYNMGNIGQEMGPAIGPQGNSMLYGNNR